MYQKIMVPLDGSELAECVLPHVEAIATGCKVAGVVFARVMRPIHLQANVPADGILGFNEEKLKQMEEQRKQAADSYLKKIVESTRIEGAALFIDYQGATLTAKAFDTVQDGLGKWLVTLAAWLFAVSTMISWISGV